MPTAVMCRDETIATIRRIARKTKSPASAVAAVALAHFALAFDQGLVARDEFTDQRGKFIRRKAA